MTIATPYTNFNRLLNGGFPDNSIAIFPSRAGLGQTEFLMRTAVSASYNNKKVAYISFENDFSYIMEQFVHYFSFDFLSKISEKENLVLLAFNSKSLSELLNQLLKLSSQGYNCFILDGFDAFFEPNKIISIFDSLRDNTPNFFALLGYHFELADNYYRSNNSFELSDLKIDRSYLEKYPTFSIFSNRLDLITKGIEPKISNIKYQFLLYKEDKIIKSDNDFLKF